LFLEGLAMVKYDSDVQACVSGWISLSGTWVVLIVKKNKRNDGVWCGFENEKEWDEYEIFLRVLLWFDSDFLLGCASERLRCVYIVKF
jgi:hypothetical protein